MKNLVLGIMLALNAVTVLAQNNTQNNIGVDAIRSKYFKFDLSDEKQRYLAILASEQKKISRGGSEIHELIAVRANNACKLLMNDSDSTALLFKGTEFKEIIIPDLPVGSEDVSGFVEGGLSLIDTRDTKISKTVVADKIKGSFWRPGRFTIALTELACSDNKTNSSKSSQYFKFNNLRENVSQRFLALLAHELRGYILALSRESKTVQSDFRSVMQERGNKVCEVLTGKKGSQAQSYIGPTLNFWANRFHGFDGAIDARYQVRDTRAKHISEITLSDQDRIGWTTNFMYTEIFTELVCN